MQNNTHLTLTTLRSLAESRIFINYLTYGLLLLLFSMVVGGLIELFIPLDSTKYLYRAVVFIPGLILLPIYLAEKQFHIFLLPACYLFFGAISTLWSYTGGIEELGSALERTLYIISLLAVVLHLNEHRKFFDKHFPILSALIILPIFLDILHYIISQSSPRLIGHLGTTNPNTAGIVYGICTVVFVNQIIKRDLIPNCQNGMLLFSSTFATTALFLTGSRACALSLLVALILFCLIRRHAKVIVLAALILLTSGVAALSINALKFSEQNITQPIKAAASRTLISNRAELWQLMVARMNTKEYIYGRGLSVDQTPNDEESFIYPHSQLISSFYYTGALGTLLHLILLLTVFYASLKAALSGKAFLACLFAMSLVPTAVDGISIHPYLGYLTPHLLIFWFLYALALPDICLQNFITNTTSEYICN